MSLEPQARAGSEGAGAGKAGSGGPGCSLVLGRATRLRIKGGCLWHRHPKAPGLSLPAALSLCEVSSSWPLPWVRKLYLEV